MENINWEDIFKIKSEEDKPFDDLFDFYNNLKKAGFEKDEALFILAEVMKKLS